GGFSGGAVQIIPEPRLNALIISAGPADLDLIEQMLKILDPDVPPQTLVTPRPRMIPIRHTNAETIVGVLQGIYGGQAAGGSSQRRPSPEEFIRALRGGGRGSGSSSAKSAAASQRQVKFGTDERTNSVIVVSTQEMFEEVRELVATLDVATPENSQTVRVVTLKRGNAASVLKALAGALGDSVQTGGSSARRPSSSSSSSPSRSSTPSPSGGQSSSGGDKQAQDAMRQRMEFFNALRSQAGGGGRPGGGSSSGGRPSFGGGSGGGRPSFGGGSSGRPSFGGRGGR
ncbi:MAG: hypothetical protein N2C14_03190, partial [Planctomycetales bacterium]